MCLWAKSNTYTLWLQSVPLYPERHTADLSPAQQSPSATWDSDTPLQRLVGKTVWTLTGAGAGSCLVLYVLVIVWRGLACWLCCCECEKGLLKGKKRLFDVTIMAHIVSAGGQYFR